MSDLSYSWLAVYRDGTIQERWKNGEEQRPAASVAEFHLLPSPAQMKSGARPYSLFLRGKEELGLGKGDIMLLVASRLPVLFSETSEHRECTACDGNPHEKQL